MPPDPSPSTINSQPPSIASPSSHRGNEPRIQQSAVQYRHGPVVSPSFHDSSSSTTSLTPRNSNSNHRSTFATSGKLEPTIARAATTSITAPTIPPRASPTLTKSNSIPNPVPCPPVLSKHYSNSSSNPITPPPSQSPPTNLPIQGPESRRTMQRPVTLNSPPSSPATKKDTRKEDVVRKTASQSLGHDPQSSPSVQTASCSNPSSRRRNMVSDQARGDFQAETPSSSSVQRSLTTNGHTNDPSGGFATKTSIVQHTPLLNSSHDNSLSSSSNSEAVSDTRSTFQQQQQQQHYHSQSHSSNNQYRPPTNSRPPQPRLPPLLPPQATSTTGGRLSRSDSFNSNSPSSPKSPDDLDSEDEEFEALVMAKKNQIRADIAAFQRSKELELVVYEKWLRDDLARKKRRKAALRNGSIAPPVQHKLGHLPGYLPLLDGGNSNSWSRQPKPIQANNAIQSTPAPALQDEAGHKQENAKAELSDNKLPQNGETSRRNPGLTVKTDEAPRVRTPPRAPSPPRTTQTTPPPLSPTSATGQRLNLPTLSFQAIRALNANEKQPPPLASSLKSTSSWSSYGGKNSRRNSSVEPPRKKKRVVFQLGLEDGGWVRVRPDGEELCRGEDPVEERKSSPDSPKNLETISIIKREQGDKFGDLVKEEESDGDQTTSTASSVVAEDDGVPDEEDWSSSSEFTATIPENLRGAPQFSDDSDDDVFDLDEEIPIDFTSNNGRVNSQVELDDTVADLGLPLAPAPPQGPSPSAIFSPRQSGSSAFERAIAQIAGFSQPRSLIGSLSSSVPLNNYSLVTPNLLTNPVSFTKTISSPVQPSSARPVFGRQSSLDQATSESSKDPVLSSKMPKITLTGPIETPPSPSVSSFKRKSISKYKATEGEDDADTDADTESTFSSPHGVVALSGRNIQQAGSRSGNGGAVPSPSPYATSLPITITPRSSGTEIIAAPTKDGVKSTGNLIDGSTIAPTDSKSVNNPPVLENGTQDPVAIQKAQRPEGKQLALEPKNSTNVSAAKRDASPQLSYTLPPLSKVKNGDAATVEPEAKNSKLPTKALTVTAPNKGSSSASGPIVQHFVTDNRSSTGSSTSNPKLQTPTKLTFPSSATGTHTTFRSFGSGSQYASAVAAEAAAAAEAEGLDGESIVGGIDGRTGPDASSLKANLLGSLGVTAGSVAKSLEKAGIKPESMSFGMRLALEEEEQSKGK